MRINRYFDAAVLKPHMTQQQARDAIAEAIAADSYTVCVRGCDIEMALEMTKGTNTGVSCVLDFPYGYGGLKAKQALTAIYCEQGVDEIDMVMNYGYARGGRWEVVQAEIQAVTEQARKHGVPVKVILETSQLTIEQIQKATEISILAGADFVKTSTGFNGEGATPEAVEAMLQTANGRIRVKPSGGIRNFETAQKYVDMGVHRLGIGYSSAKIILDGQGESGGDY